MFRALGRLLGYLSDTPLRTFIAAAMSLVVFGAIEFLVHQLLRTLDVSPLADACLDALLVGLASGIAIWVLLASNRERRERVRQELERIAELNHEIRNALQVISYAQFGAISERRDVVIESVARIDDVLRRVAPVVGGMIPDEPKPTAGQ